MSDLPEMPVAQPLDANDKPFVKIEVTLANGDTFTINSTGNHVSTGHKHFFNYPPPELDCKALAKALRLAAANLTRHAAPLRSGRVNKLARLARTLIFGKPEAH